MKKVNYLELTEKLNKFRMEHLSKTYTYNELMKELKMIGISSVYASSLLCSGAIPREKVGKAYLYSFSKEPIHRSTIESLYFNRNSYINKKKDNSKPISQEEAAMKLLQEKGYQVRRVIGFNLEKFKAENPVLYKKYLKYEVV